MTNNPVSQFEEGLRRAIRRKGNDDAIQEVVSHYHDLYQEALNKGASIEEARKHADESIGIIAEIAKGIRAGDKRSSGAKLQWMGMALFVFGAFLPFLMGMNGYEIGSLWGHIVEASRPIGLIGMYGAGFMVVLGIIRAKRIDILAICIGFALLPIGQSVYLIYRFKSLSNYDARNQAHADHWRAYAVKYRPIMHERYDLYEASIAGSQAASDQAIKKLSANVKRPQDRGAVFNESKSGKWIYPTGIQKVRDDNLNWVFFASTDSFETARRAWRSSDVLLKDIPILRKGSEAEFTRVSSMERPTSLGWIFGMSVPCALSFLYSFFLSFLLFGIVSKLKQLIMGIRRAL